MFSGTRDKALKPITKLDIEPENCARVTQAIPQEFLSRIECALGDYTLCLTQTKRKYFFCNLLGIRNEDKKEAITFFLCVRNEWEPEMSKQLAYS